MGLAEYPKPNCSCHTCGMERSHMTQIVDVMLVMIQWLSTTSVVIKHRAKAIVAAASIMNAEYDAFIDRRDAYALLDALIDCYHSYPYLLCRELWEKFGLIETAFSQMYLSRFKPETAARISTEEALDVVIAHGWCYDTGWKRLGSDRALPDGIRYEEAIYNKVYDMRIPWKEKDRLVVAAVSGVTAEEVPEELRYLYEASVPYDCAIEAPVDLVVTDDDLIEVKDEELEDLFGF